MSNKDLHIGKLIEAIVKKQGLSNAEFARRINTTRQNIPDIFKRETLDVKQLFTISEQLNHNFFDDILKDTIFEKQLIKNINSNDDIFLSIRVPIKNKEEILKLGLEEVL